METIGYDVALFNGAHGSGSTEDWKGLHDKDYPRSSLLGKRAGFCVRGDVGTGYYYFPKDQPNTRGYIASWVPMSNKGGLAKWKWMGENGNEAELAAEDAFRAVHNADANWEGPELRLKQVLQLQVMQRKESRKPLKLHKATKPMAEWASMTNMSGNLANDLRVHTIVSPFPHASNASLTAFTRVQ
jgi:hypothetical protein